MINTQKDAKKYLSQSLFEYFYENHKNEGWGWFGHYITLVHNNKKNRNPTYFNGNKRFTVCSRLQVRCDCIQYRNGLIQNLLQLQLTETLEQNTKSTLLN